MHQLVFLFLIFSCYLIIRKQIFDRISRVVLDFFSAYWFLALLLSILRVGDLKEVSDYTYFIMYLGLVSFILGFTLVRIPKSINTVITKDLFDSMINRIQKNVFFIGILIFSCIYVYYTLVKFFNAIAVAGTLSTVRTDFFSGELYGPLFAQINAFILLPFSIIATPIFAYLVFYKRNIICYSLGFFLFGYESLGGGRLGYIKIVLAVIFILYILLDSYHICKSKFLRFVGVAGGGVVVLLIVVTSLRVGSVDSKHNSESAVSEFVSQLGSYTAGPIAAFDYSIKHDYVSKFNGYQCGKLTTAGFVSMLNLFSSRVGVVFPVALEKITPIKQETSIVVNSKSDSFYNALYTANFFFYYDFGLLGVFIFPFFLGILFRLMLKRMFITKSFSMIAISCCCFYPLIVSVMDFFLVNAYLLLTLVVLYVLGNFKLKQKF